MRWILGFLVFFALWLSMSGVYKPLVVWLGAGSSLLAMIFVFRMDRAAEAAQVSASQRTVASIRYCWWLLVEIMKSNWSVVKTIMSPEMDIKQHAFQVPFSQKTELGQTIFANSITLTPGTITVEIEPGSFWVHTLKFDDETLSSLADMDGRVSATEGAN